jgi:hypothetical protein
MDCERSWKTMRQLRPVLLVLIAGTLLTAGAAQGQYGYYTTGPEERAWDIHAGIGWLTGETGDDTTWIAGLTYQWPIGDPGRDYLTFGVDYYPVDTLTTGTESVVPMLLGYRRYGQMAAYRVYFGAGIGARWASEDIPELQIDEDFEFEWGLNAGINFTPDFFGQLRYLAGSNPGDDGIIALEIGYRF